MQLIHVCNIISKVVYQLSGVEKLLRYERHYIIFDFAMTETKPKKL